MNISVLDRSNYLKGLFITAKLDKELSQKEKDILKTVSDKLGFATDFFNESVRSLLTNKYIKEEPITFTNKDVAVSFLNDAIKLACVNNLITNSEIKWLKEIADINNVDNKIIDNELNEFKQTPKSFFGKEFALFSII